ncbi:MAG: creatininase family protein, partial [Halieaceae bacterium]|nr:creatininase family protein [Halieaceae bacterium]
MKQSKTVSASIALLAVGVFLTGQVLAQSNPLWTQKKVRNYLPHMTTLEVEQFLERSDLVLIPVASLEQHADHLPIGTDFINGVERAKLIAQERDVLVAPILMAGQSPYHMGFPGT